jgi:hypothetical protein
MHAQQLRSASRVLLSISTCQQGQQVGLLVVELDGALRGAAPVVLRRQGRQQLRYSLEAWHIR